MSDLISRQDAKDAIDMALDHIDHVPPWVYDNLLNALNEVPSAEKAQLSGEDATKDATSDLIRRQDAIDALQKEINKGIPPFDDVMGSIRCGVRLARNIIEDLPSAEPETASNGSITSMNPENTHDRTMGDLISRQAAIDAIHEDADWLASQGSDWQVERMERDKSILKSLPSAEPEVIRCKDCVHYDGRPCGLVSWYNSKDDFCSRAERRGDSK